MAQPHSSRIDFEEWRNLANEDPGAFETRRAETLEKAIRHATGARQERLRRLQWRIDQVRERSANPIAACIKLNGMMMDTLLGDGGLLSHLNHFSRCEADGAHLRAASILPFRPRRRVDE